MKKCPKCGSAASGLSCQGCGMSLVEEKKPEMMIPASRVGELMEAIDQKNRTIDSLFDSHKKLEEANIVHQKKHEELSAEYSTLLAEHSAAKAEIDRLTAILNQPPSPEPISQPATETVAQ